GRRRVREWAAPLCSTSGATIQTSLDRLRAAFSRTASPGALMPSSLVTRMRALARSTDALDTGANHLQPAHVGHEHVRQCDRSVRLLKVLDERDHRTTDRQAGTVERMDEARALVAGLAEARLHPAGLELAAIGAAGDLAVGPLPWQPDLDVVGLLGGKAHIAGAERNDAIRYAQ